MSPPPPPAPQRPSPLFPPQASELTRLLGADLLSPPTPVCLDRPGVLGTKKPGYGCREAAGDPTELISLDLGAASQTQPASDYN